MVPITEASQRGISDIARQAEDGIDIVLTRHGKPVAVVMSIHKANRIRELEEDVLDAALVLARVAGDDGARFGLDEVLAEFGIGAVTKPKKKQRVK